MQDAPESGQNMIAQAIRDFVRTEGTRLHGGKEGKENNIFFGLCQKYVYLCGKDNIMKEKGMEKSERRKATARLMNNFRLMDRGNADTKDMVEFVEWMVDRLSAYFGDSKQKVMLRLMNAGLRSDEVYVQKYHDLRAEYLDSRECNPSVMNDES